PRKLDKDVPRALEAICLKAMAHRPEQRYPSPLELAQDVDQWLAGEPVRAWREPWHYQARRRLGRHQTVVTVAVAALVVAMVISTISALKLSAANELERRATKRTEVVYQRSQEAMEELFQKVIEDPLLRDLKDHRIRLLQ